MKKTRISFLISILILLMSVLPVHSFVLEEGDVLNFTISEYTGESIPDLFLIYIQFYDTDHRTFDFIINDDGLSKYTTDVQTDYNYFTARTNYKTSSCLYNNGKVEILTDLDFNKLLDGISGQILVHGGSVSTIEFDYRFGVCTDWNAYYPVPGWIIDDYYITNSTLDADFEADITSSMPPLTVNFNADESTGIILKYSWDFGDGNISNKKNPSNTYAQAGKYTVTLTLESLQTTDTETKTNYITVTRLNCPSEVLYGKNSDQAELLRQFRDNILSKTSEGQQIIKLYSQWSPVIVRAMEADEDFKKDIKELVDEILPIIEVLE